MDGLSTTSKMCFWTRKNNRIARVPPRTQSKIYRVSSAEAYKRTREIRDSIILDEVPEEDIARILSIINRESTPSAPGSPTPSSDIFHPPVVASAGVDLEDDKSPERCHTPGSATPTFGPGTPLCKSCFHILRTPMLKQVKHSLHRISAPRWQFRSIFRTSGIPTSPTTTTTHGGERSQVKA